MKKVLFIILSLVLLSLLGCDGNGRVNTLSLYDFIGDWHLNGTLNLDMEGRASTHEINAVVNIQEGQIMDNFGYTYTATLNNGVLKLTRDVMFDNRDTYCGPFEGSTEITITFMNINPFFDQAYAGETSGETAVFTQFCGYKTVFYEGTVYMQKLD